MHTCAVLFADLLLDALCHLHFQFRLSSLYFVCFAKLLLLLQSDIRGAVFHLAVSTDNGVLLHTMRLPRLSVLRASMHRCILKRIARVNRPIGVPSAARPRHSFPSPAATLPRDDLTKLQGHLRAVPPPAGGPARPDEVPAAFSFSSPTLPSKPMIF